MNSHLRDTLNSKIIKDLPHHKKVELLELLRELEDSKQTDLAKTDFISSSILSQALASKGTAIVKPGTAGSDAPTVSSFVSILIKSGR